MLVLGVLGAVAVVQTRRGKERELQRRDDELAPVKQLAFEDITAFGVDLQELDLEMSGHDLDAGATADYQRALDAYESAKTAARRPPCFFDPRHGPSVADVAFVPPDGVERDVPACALDVERVSAGPVPSAP